MTTGENNPKAKLKEEEVKVIRLSSLSNKEIADKYNIHITTVYNIKARRIWKHID